jgi:putative phosphoesterase
MDGWLAHRPLATRALVAIDALFRSHVIGYQLANVWDASLAAARCDAYRGEGMPKKVVVGVVSDTHGLLRPEAIAGLRGVAHIVHAGDIGSPEVLAALAELAPVTAVRGNNDHGQWSRAIPETATLEVADIRLYVLHDIHELDLDPRAAKMAAVIAGHSHQPLLKTQDGVLYMNPGSIGPRRFKLPVAMGKLVVESGRVTGEIIHLVLALVLFVGCTRPSRAEPPPSPVKSASPAADCGPDRFGSEASFALDRPDLLAHGASPKLLEKLDRSAYAYFRALARPFELRTCARFRDERWHLPVVAIHGDAHVEQFVVTPTTAALEDFDQSGYGPAVVDLVRYAASIHLTCREVTWSCDADRVASAYFRAYRASLDQPPQRPPLAVAARIRRDTPAAAAPWIAWAEGLFHPLSSVDEQRARRGWADFGRLDVEVHPERSAAYYDIVRVGSLQMGVGSALETKLLFRLRGPTDAPGDDLIVEARTSVPPTGNECASRPLHGGALQPLMFMTLLGPRMPEVYGFAALGTENAPEFWVQSWVPGYHELSIEDLRAEAELVELAEDAARQLAGHFWTRFPEALLPVQRHAQLKAFDSTAARATTLARQFAVETLQEWERFRATKVR